MSGRSNIEWTGHTWNPIAGCSVLTPGCTNCYAMKMAARLEAMGQELYAGLTKLSKAGPVWTGKLRMAPEHVLTAPLRRRKPTTYFVNSMSDLFHENVAAEWIDKVFAVMALTPQHTFQVLTKRAERMRKYMERLTARCDSEDGISDVLRAIGETAGVDWRKGSDVWPLPNVWVGVSTERQQEADERIPLLLQTPAAVRFISAEPLLGPIDLHGLNLATNTPSNALRGVQAVPDDSPEGYHNVNTNRLDWVIVGGESGHDARPMHPAWARSLRDQCAAAGVPFFFKQWGEYRLEPTNQHSDKEHIFATRDWDFVRFGKKAAGHLLDGKEHREMPKEAA